MKVLTVVGTRPEIIRLSRVVARLDEVFEHVLVHTGQNYDFELNGALFEQLHIRKPNCFLESAGDTASSTIAKCIDGLDKVLAKESPDAVLILGDTNSCLSVVAAKKRHIPIFHMEAGNRCFDIRVPEEVNRRILDHMSDINLVYTEHARRNLLAEGLPADQIFLTGSPMAEIFHHYAVKIQNSKILSDLSLQKSEYLVASFHREENVDETSRLKQIVNCLNDVAERLSRVVILSTHPRTQKRLDQSGMKFHLGVKTMKPFGFFDYVHLQQNSYCVISDSGTITEEAAIGDFPAVTARDAHERPEGMDHGVLLMTDLRAPRMLEAINVSRRHFDNRVIRNTPLSYQDIDVSWRVAKLIQSYTPYVNRKVWQKYIAE
jgi:UDP-N-acetylglucosamine 2-epimerase (non-hydrolysing)